MRHYIGIDLGTTNSAICSFDGQSVTISKSPQQNDVTPSAIYVDKRGNRYYGATAYNKAPSYPNDSAVLFKRFMGTQTKIEIKNLQTSLTPEECSAEILKVLFGYLPEEIRLGDCCVVITVPAAFNQMKKDATLQAAEMAGFQHVALMQEPVAAIMSAMMKIKGNQTFLIYDLGGGTFDLSIAENTGGKVNLLTHGGIEMCGGRDMDRAIYHNIVIPWLRENFRLPDDFLINSDYTVLTRLAIWAVERAKIELSSEKCSTISLTEEESRTRDLDGEEIFLNIPFTRDDMDPLIEEIIKDTIRTTRDTMAKAGLTANDIDNIVFVGGPTKYQPLRDKVTAELAIRSNLCVNAMTAVAEGASVFAESIDWSSPQHNRKPMNAHSDIGKDVLFNYVSRTTNEKAKVQFSVSRPMDLTIEVVSQDTGWVSGRAVLIDGYETILPLSQYGENQFKVMIYDTFGRSLKVPNCDISVTRTMATVESIPASSSIGVEVKEKRQGTTTVLIPLVRAGDKLPAKGMHVFRAEFALEAGSNDALHFKLWEGEIQSPVSHNQFIGDFEIKGSDFDQGAIPAGGEILCDYAMNDSGNIKLTAFVPSIGAAFRSGNFYSRKSGQLALEDREQFAEDCQDLTQRIDQIRKKLPHLDLSEAQNKVAKATELSENAGESEDTLKAQSQLREAKKLLDQTRQAHLKEMRQLDLDSCKEYYDGEIRKLATQAEQKEFDSLAKTTQRSIDQDDNDFDGYVSQLWSKIGDVLYRQDWFTIKLFNKFIANPGRISDPVQFQRLKDKGLLCIQNDNIGELRKILGSLYGLRSEDKSKSADQIIVNILKG